MHSISRPITPNRSVNFQDGPLEIIQVQTFTAAVSPEERATRPLRQVPPPEGFSENAVLKPLPPPILLDLSKGKCVPPTPEEPPPIQFNAETCEDNWPRASKRKRQICMICDQNWSVTTCNHCSKNLCENNDCAAFCPMCLDLLCVQGECVINHECIPFDEPILKLKGGAGTFVEVKFLSGESFKMRINSRVTGQQLINIVSRKSGIPIDNFSLVRRHPMVKLADNIKFEICDDETRPSKVYMVLRLRGGYEALLFA